MNGFLGFRCGVYIYATTCSRCEYEIDCGIGIFM